ncbi:hypothetical protein [Longimicrobium sp.]|uniref:hypothetical protein n=1 Tax=Longimicrobium sp. TaxID=2029185 RepID=UPI002E34F73B|nr:hypothetical protein [Longimicrobium sp.]HEX6037229.1 hypothetical protein [Longimicrobium sp.]
MSPIRIRWTFLAALAVLALGAVPARAQSSMEWIEGEWRWGNNETGCDSAQIMRVAYGGKYIISSYPDQGSRDSSEYRVLTVVPGVIRARITGETRKDAEGRAVLWDFVQLSEDSFCWRRSDWDPDGCTQPLYRCIVIGPGRDGVAVNGGDGEPWSRRRPVGR